ncbi:MAG: AMP-binding protein [Planctomycetales bacterium]|nr:AMP-binding protein [Planctomycetales bacterium]
MSLMLHEETFMTSEPAVGVPEDRTIGQVLVDAARARGNFPAVFLPQADRVISYREFLAEVDAAARGLVALGIGRGDHVAVWATNVLEWIVLQFATARIGAVLVTINPAYRPFELAYVLEQSDAVALFLVDQFKSSNYHEMVADVVAELSAATPGELHSTKFPQLRSVVSLKGDTPPGMLSWQDVLDRGKRVPAAAIERRQAELAPGDKINIQYTSGTTGFPKAATLTHRNLLLNAYYTGKCQNLTSEDRICIPVPFYHCFGCVLGTLCTVVHQAAMVIPAEYFDPEATLRAIESERATSIYGVPTMFIAQLEHPTFADRDLSSLRTGIMAGSPCPIEVMKKVVDVMGAAEITIAYGLTEASPVITQTRVDDPLDLRVKTVGRPLPGVEVKLVDPSTGQTLGDGKQGELCTRGHVVMLGYYKNPEATSAAIDKDGWLHTGDLATREPNGYYRITGRIKELIIRGGENVYPREVEEYLFTHPDIEQATVVGIPDPRLGEEICTWIILREGASLSEDDVRTFCKGQLAHFKVPRYVRFVEAFPQTVTGKIQKFKIRELMSKELGLCEQETA